MKSSQPYRRVHVMQSSESLVSTAGGALLVETVRATGLGRGLSRALRGWMSPTAVHDPGKVLLDLAVSIGLGGDCLADVAVVRAQRDLFGPVASDPTVSRLIDRLGTDVDVALDRLRVARAAARAAAWAHRSPVPATGLVPVDLDGSLVLAHSEKEKPAPTFKRTYGHHPLLAFVDHTGAGDGGGGEPLAAMLRPGSANANDAADHITVLDLALAQLSEQVRARVLVRAERGGGTKAFLAHIVGLGLQYSVGIGTNIGVDRALLAKLPTTAWSAAYDSNGEPREGAEVAELTGLLPDLNTLNLGLQGCKIVMWREPGSGCCRSRAGWRTGSAWGCWPAPSRGRPWRR